MNEETRVHVRFYYQRQNMIAMKERTPTLASLQRLMRVLCSDSFQDDKESATLEHDVLVNAVNALESVAPFVPTGTRKQWFDADLAAYKYVAEFGKMPERVCEWSEDEDGNLTTGCGYPYTGIVIGNFCLFCGQKVKVMPFKLAQMIAAGMVEQVHVDGKILWKKVKGKQNENQADISC